MRRTLVLLALALAACTRPSSVTPAGAQEERLIGVPASVGSAPMNVRVLLTPERGEGVYVTGPLAGEIRSLSGARIEVRGRRGPNRTLEATDYEVLTVNGRPATMGVVERGNGGGLQLRTRDGRIIQLQSPPADFRPGMKVWVQGPGSITVQSYGIVRT
jgi:hypothetical protein